MGHELELTGFFSCVHPFAGKVLTDDSNCFDMEKEGFFTFCSKGHLVLMSLLHLVNIVLFLFLKIKLIFPPKNVLWKNRDLATQ